MVQSNSGECVLSTNVETPKLAFDVTTFRDQLIELFYSRWRNSCFATHQDLGLWRLSGGLKGWHYEGPVSGSQEDGLFLDPGVPSLHWRDTSLPFTRRCLPRPSSCLVPIRLCQAAKG